MGSGTETQILEFDLLKGSCSGRLQKTRFFSLWYLRERQFPWM